jgi:ankyrin repeat protein
VVKSWNDQRSRTLSGKRDLLRESYKLGPKGIYEVSDGGKKVRFLYWIVINGHITILQKCLSKPHKIPFWPFKRSNEIHEEPANFLWLSIYSMKKEMVKFVLSEMNTKHIRECINEPFCSSHTPLTLACSLNAPEVVKILVQNGADINKCNNERELPLFHAVKCGSEEITYFLTSKCPIVNTQDLHNFLIKLVYETGNSNKFKLFLLNCFAKFITNDGNTPLHLAVENGFEGIVETLIRRDANINATNNMKDTPLHIACRKNNSNMVEALVASLNCDGSIQNQQGLLAFHLACRNGSLPIVKKLYDPEYLTVKDNDGLTPREYAENHGDVQKFLNRKGH